MTRTIHGLFLQTLLQIALKFTKAFDSSKMHKKTLDENFGVKSLS